MRVLFLSPHFRSAGISLHDPSSPTHPGRRGCQGRYQRTQRTPDRERSAASVPEEEGAPLAHPRRSARAILATYRGVAPDRRYHCRHGLRDAPGRVRRGCCSRCDTTNTGTPDRPLAGTRSEEHTSELQSLMRISYAVFCLQNNKKTSVQTFTFY